MKQKSLNLLQQECNSCKACELSKTRTNVVFADGNAKTSKVILIGEAPGENEDLTGTPFVGRSGKLLNEFLEKAKISREKDFYIINTVKCRPPKNRIPSKEEKEACQKFLYKQIEIIEPKLIIFCGATSLKTLTGIKTPISKIRGEMFKTKINGKIYNCTAIFHPSFLLRNHSLEENLPRDLFLKDLINIKNYLDLK